MRKSIRSLAVPALAGVVREKSAALAVAAVKNSVYAGADMIDLHLSTLDEYSRETLERIIAASNVPVLALNYNAKLDWSGAGFDENERTELLLAAVRAGASGVDMQGYTFHAPSKDAFFGDDKYSFTKCKPKEVVTDSAVIDRQLEFMERVRAEGGEVLLSCHPGVHMTCDEVVELALFLEKRSPDIIKIVTKAESEDDVPAAIATMQKLCREVKTPVAYHMNGSFGVPTRILCPLFGGKIAFCVERFGEGSTPEQIDLRAAKCASASMKNFVFQ